MVLGRVKFAIFGIAAGIENEAMFPEPSARPGSRVGGGPSLERTGAEPERSTMKGASAGAVSFGFSLAYHLAAQRGTTGGHVDMGFESIAGFGGASVIPSPRDTYAVVDFRNWDQTDSFGSYRGAPGVILGIQPEVSAGPGPLPGIRTLDDVNRAATRQASAAGSLNT